MEKAWSTWPNLECASLKRARLSAYLETSVRRKWTRDWESVFEEEISRESAVPNCSSMSPKTTWAPREWRRVTVARPMPFAPPDERIN